MVRHVEGYGRVSKTVRPVLTCRSGGIYFYFWPRGYADVPADVKVSMNSIPWNALTILGPHYSHYQCSQLGHPWCVSNPPSTCLVDFVSAANITVPNCKKDFNNHVIVFNIALCGD